MEPFDFENYRCNVAWLKRSTSVSIENVVMVTIAKNGGESSLVAVLMGIIMEDIRKELTVNFKNGINAVPQSENDKTVAKINLWSLTTLILNC